MQKSAIYSGGAGQQSPIHAVMAEAAERVSAGGFPLTQREILTRQILNQGGQHTATRSAHRVVFDHTGQGVDLTRSIHDDRSGAGLSSDVRNETRASGGRSDADSPPTAEALAQSCPDVTGALTRFSPFAADDGSLLEAAKTLQDEINAASQRRLNPSRGMMSSRARPGLSFQVYGFRDKAADE